jgi:hypothetical protein
MSRKIRSKHKRLVSLTMAPGGVKIPDRKKSRWRTFAQGNRILNSLDKEWMEDRTNRTNGPDRTDRIVCQMDPSGLTRLTDSGLTNPIGLTRPACPVNQPLPVTPCLSPPACQMTLKWDRPGLLRSQTNRHRSPDSRGGVFLLVQPVSRCQRWDIFWRRPRG